MNIEQARTLLDEADAASHALQRLRETLEGLSSKKGMAMIDAMQQGLLELQERVKAESYVTGYNEARGER